MGRGLFWFLLGAGLVREVWRFFWKWALPKPPLRIMADVILKEAYLTTITTQLNMRRTLFDVFRKPPTIEEQVQEALEIELPGERSYYRFRLWWSNNRPIITTPKRRDEKFYD